MEYPSEYPNLTKQRLIALRGNVEEELSEKRYDRPVDGNSVDALDQERMMELFGKFEASFDAWVNYYLNVFRPMISNLGIFDEPLPNIGYNSGRRILRRR